MVADVERLPPHNLEAEQSVLGSILLDRDAIIAVDPYLKPSDFYQPGHGVVYQAMAELYRRREPTDVLTLSDELSRRGQLEELGGVPFLATLMDSVPTAVHVEYYARIVERNATMRRLIDAGAAIVGIGYKEDMEVGDAIDLAERTIFDVAQDRSTADFVQISSLIEDIFDRIDSIQENRAAAVGVPTGFSELDKLTGGLQNSDLVIIAARPSVGKTSLALSMAHAAAVDHKRTVGIFSLEMQAEQVVQRILAMDSGVNLQKFRVATLNDNDWQSLGRSFGKIGEAPIFIDDTPMSGVVEIKSKARRLMAEHGLDLIIVDYLQLMESRRTENRVQQIAEISRGLKALARELNVPVVALSQLSRAIESRQDHRPMLSDLRESGAIEQDADLVVFLHRPSRYSENIDQDERDVVELVIAKHRNGPIGTVRVRFFDSTTRFSDFQVMPDPGL